MVIGNFVFDVLWSWDLMVVWMWLDVVCVFVLGIYILSWGKGIDVLQVVMVNDWYVLELFIGLEIEVLLILEIFVMKDYVVVDVLEWIWLQFVDIFGEDVILEGCVLVECVLVDLCVNIFKVNWDKFLKWLSYVGVELVNLFFVGFCIFVCLGFYCMLYVQVEEGYWKGWFEFQDEVSQFVVFFVQVGFG